MNIRFLIVFIAAFLITALFFLSSQQKLYATDFIVIGPFLLLAVVAILVFLRRNKEVLNELTNEPSTKNWAVLKRLFTGKSKE